MRTATRVLIAGFVSVLAIGILPASADAASGEDEHQSTAAAEVRPFGQRRIIRSDRFVTTPLLLSKAE